MDRKEIQQLETNALWGIVRAAAHGASSWEAAFAAAYEIDRRCEPGRHRGEAVRYLERADPIPW